MKRTFSVGLPKHPANLPISPISFYTTMNGGTAADILMVLRNKQSH